MKRQLIIFVLFLFALAINAEVTLDGLTVRDDGTIAYEGQVLYLAHQTDQFVPSSQNAQSCKPLSDYPTLDDDGVIRYQGIYTVANGKFNISEEIRKTDDGSFDITIYANSSHSISTGRFCLQISLSSAEFAGQPFWCNGEKYEFPVEANDAEIFSAYPGSKLELRRADGNGNLQISSDNAYIEILDTRQWQVPSFQAMVMATPSDGELESTEVKCHIKSLCVNSMPINIRPVVNRAFKDEFANDGIGGWTDQGSGNDLAMFPCGQKVTWAGIDLDLIDPQTNNGNGALVFMPKSNAEVVIPVNGKVLQHLNFLHAFAWCMSVPNALIGTIRVQYSDGTESEIEVHNSQDGGDWWTPVSCINGRLVWTATNRQTEIGLFLASWPLECKPIEKLILKSNPEHAWMIVAISGSDAPPSPAFTAPPQVITENDIWRATQFPREVVSGSILDFSTAVLDPPAGKYGRAKQQANGLFAFEKRPNIPVRLMGVNLSFSASFPDHALAELIAKRFAAYGINTVRFHHNDCVIAEGATYTTLNAEMMDRMDYFFACLKKHGIYVITDFTASRIIPGNAVDGFPDTLSVENVKPLVILHKGVRANLKEFIRNWLVHVNPYTGLAWKDDPALIGATISNENNLDYWLKVCGYKPVLDLRDKALTAFRQTQQKDIPDDALYHRFIAAAHKEYFDDMRNFVRSLNTELPLTDRNMGMTKFDTFCRTSYDYADNHMYIAHPTGVMPVKIDNRSVIDDYGGEMIGLGPGRLLDRAFFVTEYNWVFPHHYRAESGVLLAAYAAFQGWNGLYRYTYAHPLEALRDQSEMITFDINSDPINLFADRIGALLFSRGDIAEGKNVVSLEVSEADGDSEENYSLKIQRLMLSCKLGSLPTNSMNATIEPQDAKKSAQELYAKLKEQGYFADKGELLPKGKFARSSTGQLELDANNCTFKAISPKSEVLIRNTPGNLQGENLAITTHCQNSVLCASAMDDKTLADSNRILVIHLTNALNSESVFADREHTVYIGNGKMPILTRYGKADIQLTLNCTNADTYKVYAVALDGTRIGSVPSTLKQNILCFTADNFAFQGNVVYAYEILKQ